MDTTPTLRIDKGKSRAQDAESTEHTPLLASTSTSHSSSRDTSIEHPQAPRRLYSRLLSVFLISLSVCVLVLVLVAIIAYSYGSHASQMPPEELLQRALVVQGPDRVEVISASRTEGVLLLVSGRVGLDVGNVIKVKRNAEDSYFEALWKSLGRWGIRRLDRITTTLSSIQVSPTVHPGDVLATITPAPFELPLTADPPAKDLSWLTPVKIPVRIQPTEDVPALLRFVRESWQLGYVSVQATVAQATVHGGGLQGAGWRSLFAVSHTNIHPVINLKSGWVNSLQHVQEAQPPIVPPVPGLPPPGNNNPLPRFSDLVTLQSFEIQSANDTIHLEANATVVNPIPWDLQFVSPSVPFMIALPSPNSLSVSVAAVHSHPFSLTHPNISLTVSGNVVPLAQNASGALSVFISEYISGRDADIQIMTPLLPGLVVNTTFPAPHPKPEILQNVTISDMRIKPFGTTMVASGTVHALVVLPRGINVGVNASRVFPDVLVFDGPVPSPDGNDTSGGEGNSPPTQPMPDPLPPHAFAHIIPEDWLPAECIAVEAPEGSGSTVAVSAHIIDVPLEVLPGREREFSNFVSKVIFGTQGALAGVQGVAAVAARVNGLPFANGRDGEMELTGLPFQGSVRIGKKSVLSGLD
ncbi:hypothetical protein BC628DRAFT_1476289 [Trametes gibbosa]|nr:hypothetical protein BC628DRAFT_1476289 [Trametes gibbosa]